jgi:hypothetical protein
VCSVEFRSSLSSFSDSLRLPRTVLPSLWETVDIGVSGGVVSGRVAGGCAECVAVTSGTDPSVGVGLLTTASACCEARCVVTEDTELDRAGLAGGGGIFTLVGFVGVCIVDIEGPADVPVVCGGDIGAVYGWPNSPGAKERVEQKPSEELITKVKPSSDLATVSTPPLRR